jgi:hypothetical protein
LDPVGASALPATVAHWSSAGDVAFNAEGEIRFRRRQKTVSIVFRDDQAEVDPTRSTVDLPVPNFRVPAFLPLMIVPVASLMQIPLAPQGLGMRDR